MTIFESTSRLMLGLALIFAAGMARAADDPAMDAQVAHINGEWARIKYQVRDKSVQYRQLDALAVQAHAVAARYPGRADPLLWEGIVTSEEAAVAGVFQQLGLATSARKILERAEAINPKAAGGGVLLSLGVLYYKVPGFPIGFGSAKKARVYLQGALGLDPNGLDSNYFFANFLSAQGDRAGAKAYYARALRAPHDPSRAVWDAGRRRDAQDEMAKLG